MLEIQERRDQLWTTDLLSNPIRVKARDIPIRLGNISNKSRILTVDKINNKLNSSVNGFFIS